MSTIEIPRVVPTPDALRRRAKIKKVYERVFKNEVVNAESTGLQEASAHMESGGSIILYSRHRDRVDPMAVTLGLYNSHEVFANAPTVFPIGRHQVKFMGVDLAKICQFAGMSMNPIVTEGSIRKWHEKIDKGGGRLRRLQPVPIPQGLKEYLKGQLPAKDEGHLQFTRAAEDALKNAGIVYIPTQSERAGLLHDARKGEKTLGGLAMLARRRRIQNVGVLFVDVSTDKGDKNPTKKGGIDAFRTNHVRFGNFYTLEDAVSQAGKEDTLDAWAVEKMAELVNPTHIAPELKKRLGK